MSPKVIVLDANILIRAVLGNKVRTLITEHIETVDFLHRTFAWPMLENIYLSSLKSDQYLLSLH